MFMLYLLEFSILSYLLNSVIAAEPPAVNATKNGTRREYSEWVPWKPGYGLQSPDTLVTFPKGIVPFYIDPETYDKRTGISIQIAMDEIEASSCLVFKRMLDKPTSTSAWLHFTNPLKERECQHEPTAMENGEIRMVIAIECISGENILHTVLHAIGFKDEVSHPHRDQYVKIVWENIQPRYRPLFRMVPADPRYKIVEYDPMSVMHFHDRTYSANGGPTIAPRVPGLTIAPLDRLSQLDIMKLRLWFGHECNKRNVGALLDECRNAFGSPDKLSYSSPESIDIDKINIKVDEEQSADDKRKVKDDRPNRNIATTSDEENDDINRNIGRQKKTQKGKKSRTTKKPKKLLFKRANLLLNK